MIFDELTSAYTKEGFFSTVQKFFMKNETQGLLVIDLDDLNGVNHLNGRAVGDALLRLVVKGIYKTIPNSLVGRVGDDEFAVFVSNTTGEKQLSEFADKLVKESRTVRNVMGEKVLCTVTVGILSIVKGRYDNKTIPDLIGLAEFAMRSVKRSGGNGYAAFSQNIIDGFKRKDMIRQELQSMINDDTSVYKYQPILNIHTGKAAGCEMLARLSGASSLGNISPGEFLHIARESNMMYYFDISALKTACASLNRLAQKGMGDIYISVNLSPEFFMSPEFYPTLMKIIEESKVNVKSLIIELTEETFISSYEGTKRIIDRLNNMGIRFYVDDFGTGYSNLARLQELNMYALKMDKSLVDKLENDDSLIRKTIEIARIFNMKVVAEGIETQKQMDHLAALGCDLGQGYYIGKPMDIDDFEKFIEEHR